MMTLSTKLQESLESKIKQFEEERTMPLVSNMELRGIKHGKKIGEEIGKEIGKEIGALQNSRDDIKTVLTVRFGGISSEMEEMIGKINKLALLKEVLKSAVTANSLEEFKQSLPIIQ